MQWEDDEYLEWVEAPEWGLRRVPGGNEAGQLNKAAALPLALVDTGYQVVILEELGTRAKDRSRETDCWRR
jgi:hypothetical protein